MPNKDHGLVKPLYGIMAVFFLFFLLASCNRGERPEERLRVESSNSLSFASFNEKLSDSVDNKEPWVRDPIRIALEFMSSPGARSIKIERKDKGGEAPRTSTVTVVEDGYLDDSLRGSWTRFALERHADGTWRVTAVQRAYRCWRGHHQDSYSARLCP